MEKRAKSSWLDRLLSAAQRLLFPRERASDQVGYSRPRLDAGRHRRLAPKFFILAMALCLLAAFVYIFYQYAMTIPRIVEDPAVTNLAKPTFAARMAFGISPLCDGDGAPVADVDRGSSSFECWLRRDFDDSAWAPIQLPKLEIRKVPGYDTGLRAGYVYYRMQLPVPEHLRHSDDVISFALGAINHKRFEIWLNGRLVFEGQGRTTVEAATNITLPRADLMAGDPIVAIKAELSDGDVGILHSRGMLVGPKSVLDATYVTYERVNITYYLLIFFGKGSVFVIFALVYFYTRPQHGFFNFLMYALFITLENVIIMDAGVLAFNVRVLLYFLLKTVAIYFLLRFFVLHYRVYRARVPLLVIGAVMLLTTLGMAVDQGWGSKTVTVPMLFGVTNAMLISTLLLAIIIGTLNLLLLRRNRVDKQHLRVHQGFLLFVSIYATLVVADLFTLTIVGMDKRMVLDLFFFFYMALANARATGLNEGRIVTLEAHFEEKLRMEQELQEAASISRALLPSEVPHWPFCDIAVFHRSITESSGDWFAFERSPDGKLYHCILCDITGHGVQAAIIVSTCKAVLSGFAFDAQDVMNRPDFLVRYASRLNQLLYHHGAGLHTATFLGITFEPAIGKVHFVIGGHPSPYKVHAGSVRAMTNRGNIIGLREESDLTLLSDSFASGDQLIAFTDGVPLSTNIRVLRDFVQKQPTAPDQAPRQLYQEIWKAHTAKTSRRPDDDISIIWFRAA